MTDSNPLITAEIAHSREIIACNECDLLVRLPETSGIKKLNCPRCHHTLSITGHERLQRALPLSICAALLLPLCLMFPFMSFESAGVTNEMTLLQTSWALAKEGSTILGILILGFIVLTPAALVACTMMVACTISMQRWIPGVKYAARFISTLTSWNMAEVFIIGVFVSLVKIASMAKIELGISLWSYLALSIILVGTVVSLDKVSVWRNLSALEPKK